MPWIETHITTAGVTKVVYYQPIYIYISANVRVQKVPKSVHVNEGITWSAAVQKKLNRRLS